MGEFLDLISEVEAVENELTSVRQVLHWSSCISNPARRELLRLLGA